MPSTPARSARRSTRIESKRRASLVINLESKPKRLPCLVVDSSKEGFRLRGDFHLIRRGQVVELILDEDMPNPQRCSVIWVGKAGSKQDGEVGLEIV
ncbi:MAG TPA: PilZ domain-containing protein [Candidatus Cybelea sp.]|nr:PilZ domain-containing protein [Candidatus Cybelea sp.]